MKIKIDKGLIWGFGIAVACFVITLLVLWMINKKEGIIFDISSKYIDKLDESRSKELLKNRDRVVVSFSTIPSRVDYVPKIIEKLKAQTIQPDAIYACIPKFSKRMKKPYVVSSYPYMGDNVHIVRCDDYGPGTKLMGMVPYEHDPKTMIITIDDDQTYKENTIEKLVTYAMNYPDSAVGFKSMNVGLDATYCPNDHHIKSPEAFFLEGFGAILYRRKFLSDDMVKYFEGLSPACFVSDDLVISTWLEMQGIERIKICDEVRETDEEIDQNDPLRLDFRNEVYYSCYKEMMKLKERMKYGKEIPQQEWEKNVNELKTPKYEFVMNETA